MLVWVLPSRKNYGSIASTNYVKLVLMPSVGLIILPPMWPSMCATRWVSSASTKTDSWAKAWFEVVVTNATSVSFDWKCSCEELPKKGEPYDHLEFSIDGTRVAYIGGETDWTNMTFEVDGQGEHVFRWTYSKDESDAEGEDCAWVANVVITYAQEPEIRFTSISVEEESITVAVSMMVGETAQVISSTEAKDWLEATSDLSDWLGGALAIMVEDLTQGVAETVRFRVTFTDGAPLRAFLRARKQD